MRLFQAIYSAIRCPLNHHWRLIHADGERVEHVCTKCGKRTVRIL